MLTDFDLPSLKRTACALLLAVSGCGGDGASGGRPDAGDDAGAQSTTAWTQFLTVPAAALLSVHGRSESDVWVAGANDGEGPLVAHWDGERWERHLPDTEADLWWVHAASDDSVWLSGTQGTLLRFQDGAFEQLQVPEPDAGTVFGVWAAGPDDVYAVGAGDAGQAGFMWHFDGASVREVALPALAENADRPPPGLFKVWARSPQDVWAVGSSGVVLHGSADAGFERVLSPVAARLFTVHGDASRVIAVGGEASGTLVEQQDGEFVERTPERAPLLQGISVGPDGSAWAVGLAGSIYRDVGDGFEPVDPGLDVGATQVLHAVWVDPLGQVWAAGGNVFSERLDQGVLLFRGDRPKDAAELPHAL